MSSFRNLPMIRSVIASSSRQRLTPAVFTKSRLAHQSYGGGEGDPKGENPQDQGSNPSADLEHPGPPPPSVGKGTGGGPTKAAGESQNSTKKEASGGSGAGQNGGTSNGAQPKIHSEPTPTEGNEDVRKHNEELSNRYERASNAIEEGDKHNVGKGYWKGKDSSHLWRSNIR